ncbi:hypothetical protein AAFF_G00358980 [Aldrovandia affinis]|uniref:Uncharacterized protein n=1 Tax=Aldrovandia affinis TaxID=143900 RepID=A0AAD7SIZ3_9TELE|nr:hypothetical protein AAFF_G00358980 [Aldrovandia affinis]
MAGELEKDKASLGDDMRRVEAHNLALEEKVSNLTKKLEEKQQQCLNIQESQDQAKEEYARALGDAQTRLAQKEAELRKAAENQASKAEQLRCRVEQVESILTENDALRTNLAVLERIQTVKTQEMNVLRDQTMALNVELQQRQTEQEKLLAQRDDVSSQLQEVNRANSRLLEQLTELGQEKDKLQQELEETRKTAEKSALEHQEQAQYDTDLPFPLRTDVPRTFHYTYTPLRLMAHADESRAWICAAMGWNSPGPQRPVPCQGVASGQGKRVLRRRPHVHEHFISQESATWKQLTRHQSEGLEGLPGTGTRADIGCQMCEGTSEAPLHCAAAAERHYPSILHPRGPRAPLRARRSRAPLAPNEAVTAAEPFRGAR